MSRRLEKVKVLAPENPNCATKLFGGKASGILNYNDIPYPHFYGLRQDIRGLFWKASEVNLQDDKKQFPLLPPKVQSTFLKVFGTLGSMDAPQTVVAALISAYATDPSVKAIFATIADQEAEHNHSYTTDLSTVVPFKQQLEAFEVGRTNPILLERNAKITEVYNEFADDPTIEKLAKVLVYSSILEGLYFYSGFAFFYNLARQGKMIGSSTMISFINRDELYHSRFISELFRALLGENPELNTQDFASWVYDQFREAVDQETRWSQELLTGIDGISLTEMSGYIKYRANKMLRMMGLSEIYPEHIDNPMKWIRAYVDNFDGTKTDIFEQKPRTYAKVNKSNGFDKL